MFLYRSFERKKERHCSILSEIKNELFLFNKQGKLSTCLINDISTCTSSLIYIYVVSKNKVCVGNKLGRRNSKTFFFLAMSGASVYRIVFGLYIVRT